MRITEASDCPYAARATGSDLASSVRGVQAALGDVGKEKIRCRREAGVAALEFAWDFDVPASLEKTNAVGDIARRRVNSADVWGLLRWDSP